MTDPRVTVDLMVDTRKLNDYEDPTGVAAVVISAAAPVIALVALLLNWSTDLSDTVLAALAGVVQAAVALVAVLRARRSAYAPSTVNSVVHDTAEQAYALGKAVSS